MPEDLYIKRAYGFAIWNGQRGSEARVYLIPMERQGHAKGVIRFLGGTAVPPRFTKVKPRVQSLIRLQAYFGPDVVISPDDAHDVVPLHFLRVGKIDIFTNPNTLGTAAVSQSAQGDSGTRSHEVPNRELHALLPASEAFIDKFYPKLEQVWLDQYGRVQTQTGRLFNNVAIIHILRHMLAQVQGESPMQLQTANEPAWNNGDYTAAGDT